ncbi:DMT family transporter [Pseudothauera rhizosphaerae]|uniref:DMT family transporter n=1 Tax=Pseudothauera rhizosphaerae TaxID=2565932 RepID=A0A4S4AQN0_9RHOO|nr:DMT family transporter [Pseudothauera rhizosphaerae]THF61997.1 DMT family transporter [Pseudothauera rhizosphaerae]
MPPTKTHLDRFAIGLMVLFCTIWGVQQVAVKVANAGISPVWQAGLRSIGATALVFAWALARRVRLFKTDGTLAAGVLAGLLFAAEFALLFIGLQYTSASRGVIFLYTAPFFLALGAVWLLPHEPMRRAQWAGMALAFGGVLVLFGENLIGPAGEAWKGDLLIFIAAIFWAATTLTVKATALVRVSAEKTLLYQLAVSAVVLPPLSLALGEPGMFAPTPAVWASLVFQIVAVASASYVGWFWLVRQYPATRLASFSFLTPVMGVLAGGVLLGEPLTPAVFAALGLVGLGIWIANRPTPRNRV